MTFLNIYGLINSTNDHPSDPDENTFPYSMRYIMRWGMRFEGSLELRSAMFSWLRRMVGSNGFYNQIIINDRTNPEDIYLSPDQMEAYCQFSVLNGLYLHKIIWKQLKANWFSYDNQTGKFNIKRIMHPRTIIFVGLLNGSFLCLCCIPLMWIMALWTHITHAFQEDNTSTDILWRQIWFVYDMPVLRTICQFITKLKWGGESQLYNQYHKDENHPINIGELN